MSNGFGPIGMVPVTTIDYDTQEGPTNDSLNVGSAWTSAWSGIELSLEGVRGQRVVIDNDIAITLAMLILHGTAPAQIPGNGYEEWEASVREKITALFTTAGTSLVQVALAKADANPFDHDYDAEAVAAWRAKEGRA
jgi:hypothetical protein